MLSGTIYSIPSDDSWLAVKGETIVFPTVLQFVLIIAGQTFPAAPTGYPVNGQRVTIDGPANTFLGTVLSLGPPGL